MAESCGCRAVEDASLRDTDEVALCPLHAAAPELLEALKTLLNTWWAEFSDFFGGDAEADAENRADFDALPAVVAARAAIAKAEGRANA